MDKLRDENFREALSYLKRAKILLDTEQRSEETLHLLSITLNNLSCLYKKKGNYKVSLGYMKEVLLLELRSGKDDSNIGGTHLNICAILSQMGQHEKALKHVQKAIAYFSKVGDDGPNVLTMKIVALHNAGAEYEHLGMFQQCLGVYQNGFELARKYFGLKHQMTQTLKKSIADISSKLQSATFDSSEAYRGRYVGRSRNKSVAPRVSPRVGKAQASSNTPPKRRRYRSVTPRDKGAAKLPPVRTKDFRLTFRMTAAATGPGPIKHPHNLTSRSANDSSAEQATIILPKSTQTAQPKTLLTRAEYTEILQRVAGGTRRIKTPGTKLKAYI